MVKMSASPPAADVGRVHLKESAECQQRPCETAAEPVTVAKMPHGVQFSSFCPRLCPPMVAMLSQSLKTKLGVWRLIGGPLRFRGES